jgi:plastocyanin
MATMKRAPLTVVLAATLAVAATSAAGAGPPRTATVTLKDISFHRSAVQLARGGRVTWVWKDGPSPHNVTFAMRHSPTQKTGTYTLKFPRKGTFRYHCTLHPGMDGRVTVR